MTGARPGRLSARLSLGAALLALLAMTPSRGALLAGGLGAVVLGFGLRNDSGPILSLGAALLGAALLFASTGALPIALSLVGAVALALAWDLGTYAVSLRHEMDPESSTRRAELAHAATSALALSGVATAGFLVFALSPARQPAAGVSALLFAGLVLIALLGE